MKKTFGIFYFLLLFLFLSCHKNQDDLRISLEEYRDKMKGAWIGQMAGVGWGLPTEFKWPDSIIPADQVPSWSPPMVNQHGNDDLYVEMTFLSTLEKYGIDVSIRQAGIDFANSGYGLWAANQAGRENLRYGIAPPESSHPFYSNNCDDIDYQIEADFSGIIAPGMPNASITLGEKFGRLMNYGDGLYGGQLVGGMYTSAFFEKDINKVIRAGLDCIPAESNYARCINDVIKWHHQNPDDWQKTWQMIEDKYRHSPEFQGFATQRTNVWIPIDAKLNGAYIVMGLLYGKGNIDSTMVISMRCGKDSDCNPSNAAGVVAAMIGYENLPVKFKSALDLSDQFQYSDYDFNKLIQVCEKLTRELVVKNGGEIRRENDGMEYFSIPQQKPEPSPFLPSYRPGPCDTANIFTPEEKTRIQAYAAREFLPAMREWDLDAKVFFCGKSIVPGLINWKGKPSVLVTAPMNQNRGASINLKNKIPVLPGKMAIFHFSAGHEEAEKWKLQIMKDGKVVLEQEISDQTSNNGWVDIQLDVSDWAGKENTELFINAIPLGESTSRNYWTKFDLIQK